MATTVTVHIDDDLARALRELARREGLPLAVLARRILDDAVQERRLSERARHLAGALGALGTGFDEAWRDQIHRRNWRD